MIGKPPFSEKRFAAAQQRFRRALRRAYLAAAGTVWAASRRRASFPYTSRRVGMGSNLPPLSNDHRLSLVQYVSAEWEPAFLRQAREFPFFPLLPREASK